MIVAGVSTGLLVLLLTVAYLIQRRAHRFFSDRGIPGPKPWPFIGNILDDWWSNRSWIQSHEHREQQYGKVYGVFHALTPTLVVSDVSLLKQILVRDFSHFTDRQTDHRPMISRYLIAAKGDHWRRLRKAVGPAFTPHNLKSQKGIVRQASDRLVTYVTDCVSRGRDSFELRSLMTLFALDVGLVTGLGIEVDVYHTQDPQIRSIARPNQQDDRLVTLTSLILPDCLRRCLGIGTEEQTESVFLIASQTLRQRRSGSSISSSASKDFVTTFLKSDMGLSDEDIIFNLTAMFLGGYDAMAILLSCTIFLLSRRPELQQRLLQEVRTSQESDTDHHPLLQSLVSEVLRLYPPSCFLRRQVTQEFRLNGVMLPVGLRVFVPSFCIGRHEDNFSDPVTYDPERFLKRDEDVEDSACSLRCDRFAILAFGQGPRNCPAIRSSLLQVEDLLCRLIEVFQFLPSSRFESSDDIDFSQTMDEELTTQPLVVTFCRRPSSNYSPTV